MKLFRQPETVESYKRLRAASRGLVTKVHKAIRAFDFDMLKAAKKMTLPLRDRTFVFNDELEMAAFMDFYIHEFHKGGRRIIESCDPATMEITADQRDLLEAHRLAETSLFEIVALDPAKAQVHFRNILSPDRPDVILSDISMSRMGEAAATGLLFFRVVACQGIQMSSGSFFAFSPIHRERLLDGYARRMKTVPADEVSERRFIFFYQRHREFGAAQALDTPE